MSCSVFSRLPAWVQEIIRCQRVLRLGMGLGVTICRRPAVVQEDRTAVKDGKPYVASRWFWCKEHAGEK